MLRKIFLVICHEGYFLLLIILVWVGLYCTASASEPEREDITQHTAEQKDAQATSGIQPINLDNTYQDKAPFRCDS